MTSVYFNHYLSPTTHRNDSVRCWHNHIYPLSLSTRLIVVCESFSMMPYYAIRKNAVAVTKIAAATATIDDGPSFYHITIPGRNGFGIEIMSHPPWEPIPAVHLQIAIDLCPACPESCKLFEYWKDRNGKISILCVISQMSAVGRLFSFQARVISDQNIDGNLRNIKPC